MAELIYHVATTADHFIADENGNCPPELFPYEEEAVADFFKQIREYDLVLMGGRTYAFGYQFGLKPGEQGYKGIKHIVFSKTLDFPSSDEVELVRTDASEYVRRLKTQTGKKIWLCGGGELAGKLFDDELIDKLILKVNHSIAGSGIPLFGKSRKKAGLHLQDSRIYDCGQVRLHYKIVY